MNNSQHISTVAVGTSETGANTGLEKSLAVQCSEGSVFTRISGGFARLFSARQQSKSILRNQTNLPAFLAVALGLSLLCNFTLRENTAEASRPIGTGASIEQVLILVRANPDDYELHSRLGELYYLNRQYKRAMFHLAESSRLMERFGE